MYATLTADLRQAIDSSMFLKENSSHFNRDDIANWLLNFQKDDRPSALRLLNELKYIDEDYFRRLIRSLYKALAQYQNPCFVGFGDAADSSDRMSYHFRIENKLRDDQFLSYANLNQFDRSKFNGIVFLDDFIGTGNQAISNYYKTISPIEGDLQPMFLVYGALVACEEGEANIASATNLEVVTAMTIEQRDKAFYPDSIFEYTDLPSVIQKFRRYGQSLYPMGPLGYDNLQTMVAFSYNTPNNTLPIFWSTKAGWSAITERKEAVQVKPSRAERAIDALREAGVPTSRLPMWVDAHKKYVDDYEFIESRNFSGSLHALELLNARNEICKFTIDEVECYSTLLVGMSLGWFAGATDVESLSKHIQVSAARIVSSCRKGARITVDRAGRLGMPKHDLKMVVFDWGDTIVDEYNLDEAICDYIPLVEPSDSISPGLADKRTSENALSFKNLLSDLEARQDHRWYDYVYLAGKYGKTVDDLRRAHLTHDQKIRPLFDFPAVSNALRRAGVAVVVATNCERSILDMRCSLLGWDLNELSDDIYTSDKINNVADKSAVMDAILNESKLLPDKILWVGDSYERDVVTAKFRGMRTFFVPGRRDLRSHWGSPTLALKPQRMHIARLAIGGPAIDFCAHSPIHVCDIVKGLP